MNPNNYFYTESDQPSIPKPPSWSGLESLIDDYFRFAWYDRETNAVLRRPPQTNFHGYKK